jgi:hypothetical protein
MPYATVADVAARMGRGLDESETQIVTARLNDVELIIKSRIPDLAAKVLSGKLSASLVAMIETDAVMRILKNPDGIVGETDGNYSYQLNWATVTGRLMLMPEEWKLLGVGRSVFLINATLPNPCGREEGESLGSDDDRQAVWWGD